MSTSQLLRSPAKKPLSLSQPLQESIGSHKQSSDEPKVIYVWQNIFAFLLLHSSIIYGAFKLFTNPPWLTMAFATLVGHMSALGVTAGAHRLWSHRAYKAKLPLRIFLAALQTTAGQNNIFEWCRDHRVHHKFCETDADPYNANRGFFFAHMGWLCVKKHPDVINKGQSVDCSDLLKDPVVRFQRSYFMPLAILCCLIIPSIIPIIFWSETYLNAFLIAGLARYCISLHLTWLINSVAHLWGNRPYDITIGARENRYVIYVSIGEGFHNYHHTFPSDYSASELGMEWNLTTRFINVMYYIGQAYDLKSTPTRLIKDRIKRTGCLK
ncbi:acyl-CoA desaturase 1 [Tetranychus urticae]|uniref:Fatty acid desaturase domain-containing protein n=1 Tax=Tetranychus urticae TaxID=32264 RepID=T1KGE1_TETUR|nr:acyl-CoA desaturase 1 [Tetranychus urticae]